MPYEGKLKFHMNNNNNLFEIGILEAPMKDILKI